MSDRQARKVLLIVYDFPPRRSSGVYRPTGLTKYLPRFGWEPTVLTVEGTEGATEDHTLLGKLPPQVRVVRTPYLHVAGWEKPAAGGLGSAGLLNPQHQGRLRLQLNAAVRSVARWVRYVLYFPDDAVGWIPFGLSRALALVLGRQYDLVYTTSLPRSTAVMGLALRKLSGIPWVAEFRDPLYLPRDVQPLFHQDSCPARQNLEEKLQALIFRTADTVVAVTRGYAEELVRVHKLSPEKVAVVTNGFDEDDFNSDHHVEGNSLAPGFVNLTHFGTIYPRFSGKFFPALLELVRDCPQVKQRLRIHIIGGPDDEVLQYSREPDLKDMVSIRGLLNHSDALKAMRSSDALLLFYAHPYISQVCVPGKVYEYLRVGPPIFAITFEGGLKKLIDDGNAGWAVHPEDTQGLKNTLRELVFGDPEKRRQRRASLDFVAQFQYDHLAANLARIFERVARHAR